MPLCCTFHADLPVSIARNSTYNIVGAILPIALALVTVPVYLKLVGSDRYGVLAIAWLLLGYFGMFDLGLGRATAQRIASLRDGEPSERAATFWTAFAVNVAMGLVGALIFWPVAHYLFGNVFKIDPSLRGEVMAAVPFLALAVPVATTTGVLTGALQGRERFLEVNVISVLSTTLFQLLPLAVAWLHGPNLPVLLLAAVSARLLAVFVLWQRCADDLVRGHPKAPQRRLVKPLLSYGGWVMVTSMVGPMLVITDRFIIGAILGAVVVGHYSVVFQLAERVTVIPIAIVNAMFPRWATLQGDEGRQLSLAATRAILTVMTPIMIGGIFILDPFLSLWVGPAIAHEVGFVGKILLISYWISSLGVVPYGQLQATGRPDLVSKIFLIEVPFYVPALYWAISTFGLVGAGVTFCLRLVIDYTLLSYLAGRVLAVWPTLVSAGFLVLGLALSEMDGIPLLANLGIGAVLGLVALAFGLRNAPAQLHGMIERFWPWGARFIPGMR
jgi:O-antigen/teichoic acid export membrane protein